MKIDLIRIETLIF